MLPVHMNLTHFTTRLGLGLLLAIYSQPSICSGDTHTWTGAAITPNWSTPANWENDKVPSPAEAHPVTLVFPLGAARTENVNNLVGLQVDSIVFSGLGYVIKGNALKLGNALTTILASGDGNAMQTPLELTQPGHVITVGTGRSLFLAGPLIGAGGLKKLGRGDLWLSGPDANTYSGETAVLGGALNLSKTGGQLALGGSLTIGDTNGLAFPNVPFDSVVRLNAEQQIPINASVTINPDGQLHLDTHQLVLSSLTMVGNSEIARGQGGQLILLGEFNAPFQGYFANSPQVDCPIALDGGGCVFNIETPYMGFSEVIMGNGGSAKLIKKGPGMMDLKADCSYAGSTTVAEGELSVNNSLLSPSILVKSNAWFGRYGEVGTITCQGGGVLPKISKDPSRKNLHCLGLSLDAHSHFYIAIDDTALGVPSFLNVDGLVNLGGCEFSPTLYTNANFDIFPGAQWLVIDNDGNDPIVGTFAGLPEGAKLYFGGHQWQITYTGGTGNDVALQLLTKQLPLIITSISPNPIVPSFLDVIGVGVPGVDTYQLQSTTNFIDWVVKDPHVFNLNGTLKSGDYVNPTIKGRYFRFMHP